MHEKIIQSCIYPVMEQMKGQVSRADELKLRPDAALFAAEGPLDSIELVRMIILVEERVKKELGVTVRLATLTAVTREDSPFSTVGALATFIEQLVREATP